MDEPDRRNRNRARRKALGHSIEVVSLVIVAIATAITAYQAYLTREGLINAINDDRAWLRVEVWPHNGIGIDAAGAHADLHVSAENVGKVPAVGVLGSITVVAAPMDPKTNKAKPHQPLSRCPTSQDKEKGGVTIFPGEKVQLLAQPYNPSQADLRLMVNAAHKVAFLVHACVTYRSGVRSHDQTSSVTYFVERSDTPPSIYEFDIRGDGVQGSSIRLDRLGADDRAE